MENNPVPQVAEKHGWTKPMVWSPVAAMLQKKPRMTFIVRQDKLFVILLFFYLNKVCLILVTLK